MKNSKLFGILALLVLCATAVTAVCVFSTQGNSQDYFGINTASDNVSTLNLTQRWIDWDFFTPRLNFSRQVNDTFVANVLGANSTINWLSTVNFSSTLILKNVSTVINETNYTLVQSGTNQWHIFWKDSRYNGSVVTATFNRTFVKNVDDIVQHPENIYSGGTRALFLSENNPTDYGDYKLFRFNGNALGKFINDSNWSVGWNYTQADCNVGNTGCNAGATSLWGTLELVVVAGFLLWLFATLSEGSLSIALIVIASIVTLLIPFLMKILGMGC